MLDVIIFGATGTLGSYTVMHAATILSGIKWGIAGRNRNNLEAVLRNVGALTNKKCNDIPIFLVDANDANCVFCLAQQTRVVVNCCGPYEQYAANVIQACIAAGTHYVDASIEPSLLSVVRSRFHDDAASKQVYVVSSCGFFSFVNDLGINFVEREFSGTVDTVDAYLQFARLGDEGLAPLVHCTTWNTLIATMTNARNLVKDCNSNLATVAAVSVANSCISCTQEAPTTSSKQQPCSSTSVNQAEDISGVSIPLPLIDAYLVKESQHQISETEGKQPLQFRNYLTVPTYFMAFLTIIWCVVIFIFSQTPSTRELLLKFPRLFSLGMCTNQCMEKQSVEQLVFSITYKATGYDTSQAANSSTSKKCCATSSPSPKCSNVAVQKKTARTKKTLNVKICGQNPFYGIGCVALLCSAITILKQSDKMPCKGGVFLPGAAFRNTQILQEAAKHNARFKYKVK